ncbi:MAG: hypothetical protein COV36_07080 [Alphaproteobacteria bacterium CG11_big_fil_rev_8_21_14_0_20_44_7]|nr:MAG: hypothetical protein COV36_07080 [Alphaproteobacteria bacterium CG11_big_fil_rev_8_21_14_0_20_44_7]
MSENNDSNPYHAIRTRLLEFLAEHFNQRPDFSEFVSTGNATIPFVGEDKQHKPKAIIRIQDLFAKVGYHELSAYREVLESNDRDDESQWSVTFPCGDPDFVKALEKIITREREGLKGATIGELGDEIAALEGAASKLNDKIQALYDELQDRLTIFIENIKKSNWDCDISTNRTAHSIQVTLTGSDHKAVHDLAVSKLHRAECDGCVEGPTTDNSIHFTVLASSNLAKALGAIEAEQNRISLPGRGFTLWTEKRDEITGAALTVAR